LAKKTWFRSPGASAASSRARAKLAGCPIWKLGAKSSVAAERWMASTIAGRQCPAFTHNSPAVPSRTTRPFTSR
jgi:hypothetical protein